MYIIDKTSCCWNWTGTVSRNGYGVAHTGRSSMTAHRYVYRRERGPIPAGLELDHLCRNKLCVNPAHLEPVTHAENMRRHAPFDLRVISNLCKHGHPLDGIRTRAQQGRYCKTCVRLNKRRQRAKLPQNETFRASVPA